MRDLKDDLSAEEMREKTLAFITEQLESSGITLTSSLQAVGGDGVCMITSLDIENDEDNTFVKKAFAMLINAADEEALNYAKELIEAEIEFINGE